ncbi:hypothetical protein [Bacteriovorax sp. DB6_IX]|uniref:hypothetical protein n=1 Tax=Bacteriovorax sp. DB6_IX TaxID=1353530 RepID=UPI00041198C6|nr:hypothetical protein [Bacteriovorax sp. DB6_IX]
MKTLLILCFLIFTPVELKAQDANDALAFCWKNKQGLWWCDGPLQILWNGAPKIKIALVKVGCDNHKNFRPWAGNNRVGYLFNCGKDLKDFDRNIRERYGIRN